MLPMILGFLGAAFAPAIGAATGIAALASPLLAGSVGAGLGSFAQTGDLGQGLKTGLGAYAGGALLGGLFGGGAAGAAAGGATGAAGAAGATGAAGAAGTAAAAPAGGLASLFSGAAPGSTASILGTPATAGPTAIQSGMNFLKTPVGLGAMLGTAATSPPPPTMKMPDLNATPEVVDIPEMRPIPRPVVMPPEGYRPGVDPEFDYGVSTPYSYEQLMAYNRDGTLPYGPAPTVVTPTVTQPLQPPRRPPRMMAEGGETEIEVDEDTGAMEAETERPVAGNEKTEIVDAIMAIKGQHPQPEVALGKFLAKYGEDALRDLVDSVQSGEFDETLTRFREGEKGMVRGPGDGSGKDDKVPATIDGEQDVLLTDGEFVMRKSATDALEKKYGGGFLSAVNKAGERAPEVLKRKVAA